MSLLTKAGIERLSELEIDADKDWQAQGISNLKELAAAMIKGDLVVKGNSILDKLPAGPMGYVLTSTGVGQKPAWAPGPVPAFLYFPVWIGISAPTAATVTPDHTRAVDAPMISLHDETIVATKVPAIDLAVSADLFTPDYSEAESMAPGSCHHHEVRTVAVPGYDGVGANSISIADHIRGSRFMCMQDGEIDSIDVYIQVTDNGGGVDVPVKCAIYDVHGRFLKGVHPAVDIAAGPAAWHKFILTSNQAVTIGHEYWVLVWAEGIADMEAEAFYDSGPGCDIAIDQGLVLPETFNGFPNTLVGHTREQTKFSIHGNYV